MKKFISYVLLTAVILSLGAGVIAEENKSIEVTYTIDPNAYVISMPSTLDMTSKTDTFTVSLTECHSNGGVSFYITSANGMKLKCAEADNDLTYSISPNPDSSSPLTLKNGSPNKEFTVTVTGETKTAAAGTYTDTLTLHFSPNN